MIQDAIYWLNSLPPDNKVSDTLSPDEILQRLPNLNYDNLTINFESYDQVHTGTKKLPSHER